MSYDTEHVRNAGDGPGDITGIPTFTELLTNPNLAALYTAIRNSAATTGPEFVEMAPVSKKTVYEYLDQLAQAGLITEIDTETGARAYETEEFELRLTIRDIEVSITPELVRVVAQEETYPVISRVREEHGLVTLILAHDLIKAHEQGEVTTRQIGALTGLSTGTTYDLVEALYEIRNLGDAESSPQTYAPDDFETDPADSLEDSLGQ